CTRVNPTTGKACNTTFSRRYDYVKHIATAHSILHKKYRCEICGQNTFWSSRLVKHKKV
ncbi:hypothetical protein BDZ91DRAFT_633994, partial [Kalaharituber pfeilii]